MQEKIRNFCIIAHIDHGKSTLADRLLELTGTVDKRDMKAQLLDKMELEREKGITIKLAPVRMDYQGYELNLIDTPGHVDFSYEVSRSLQACEGALLVVDASQGIQAQTLANVYLAMAADLTIIPVLNKIDLPAADVERVSAEVISLLGCEKKDILLISAKTGDGVPQVLDKIIELVPPPKASEASETRALIFDSYYDDYRGVILYVRAFDGVIDKNAQIKMMATGAAGLALEVGTLKPDMTPGSQLAAGEIGYIVTNLKSTREAKVGDTITLAAKPAAAPLPGYKDVQPFVYADQFFFNNHVGYMGLQDEGNDGNGHVLAKSAMAQIYGAIDASSANGAVSGCGNPSDEGYGCYLHANFSWQTGHTYRFVLNLQSADDIRGNEIWHAQFSDITTGTLHNLGTITTPGDFQKLGNAILTFHERFSGATDSCYDQMASSASYSNVLVNGSVNGVASTPNNYQSPCPGFVKTAKTVSSGATIITSSYAAANQTGLANVPLYRASSPAYSQPALYSFNQQRVSNWIASGYINLATMGFISSKKHISELPLYEFYSTNNNGTYIDTTAALPPNQISLNGYYLEPVNQPIGYISSQPLGNSIQLWRLYYPKNKTYIYTTNLSEINLDLSKGYTSQTSVGYIYY